MRTDQLEGRNIYTSRFEINLSAIVRNAQRIHRWIGANCSIIGVIKGDGYGYGLVKMSETLTMHCDVDVLAVAHVCEGVRLREAGINCDIMLLAAIPDDLATVAIDDSLIVPLADLDDAKRLESIAAAHGRTLKVQIKLETGMHRMGVCPGAELEELVTFLRSAGHLEMVGFYTHFATSRVFNNSYTYKQLELFKSGLKQIRSYGLNPKYVHSFNSGATMWLKSCDITYVRCASLFNGYPRLNNCEEPNPLGLEPTSSWRTRIAHIHMLAPGQTMGYGRHFKADAEYRVGIIPIGSNDGVIRDVAQNFGPVIVNGQMTRYLGCCMDQSFVDLTGITAELGSDVTVFGKDGECEVTPLDLLKMTPYMTCSQCFTNIGPRVDRVYLWENGEE